MNLCIFMTFVPNYGTFKIGPVFQQLRVWFPNLIHYIATMPWAFATGDTADPQRWFVGYVLIFIHSVAGLFALRPLTVFAAPLVRLLSPPFSAPANRKLFQADYPGFHLISSSSEPPLIIEFEIEGEPGGRGEWTAKKAPSRANVAIPIKNIAQDHPVMPKCPRL